MRLRMSWISRFVLPAFLIAVSPAACSRHSPTTISEALFDIRREPPGVLRAEDYDIMRTVLDDVCSRSAIHDVWIQPFTLSFEDLRDCDRSHSKAYFADRFDIDSALFRRLAHKVPIDVEKMPSTELNAAHTDVRESQLPGLRVAMTLPVFSNSGRAFVYVMTAGSAEGGDLFYCLKRTEQQWGIERSAVLSMQ
jgi:hypothetical protein